MTVFSMKGIGWFVGGVVVALGFYTMTSRVAAERDRLDAIDQSIVQARGDLRMLDAEFNTRANLAQIQQWNGDILRLGAPAAGQIVSGEAALAAIGRSPSEPVQSYASYVVPEAAPVLARAEVINTSTTTEVLPVAKAAPIDTKPVRGVVTASVGTRRIKADKVASLDNRLLSETSFGDLLRGASGAAVQ